MGYLEGPRWGEERSPKDTHSTLYTFYVYKGMAARSYLL